MNGEETIFPRRDIYMGSMQNAYYRHIHRMSIGCSSPLFKILAKFQLLDLKQNAFLRQWIYYKKPLSLGKANKFSLLSLTRGFAPH